MRRLFTIALSILSISSFAQESNPHFTYVNRKTIALGYTGIGISAPQLNTLLEDYGYKSISPAIGAITVNVSTDFSPHWGGYYGADFGIIDNEGTTGKYQRFQYYRFYAGVELSAVKLQRFELLGHLALSYSDATLRLYDTVADTNSFNNYLAGKSDAKRIHIGAWGLDVGFQTRFRITDHIFLGLGGGYIIHMGSNDWNHDAGTLHGAPSAGLGSWYVGARIGGLFCRRITRIPSAEFEQKDSPTSSTPVL